MTMSDALEKDPNLSYWPRGVMDPFCPDEHVITETMDRRILWHLEGFLAVSGTTDYHREMQRNLAIYLNQTCAHHWHAYEADEDIGAHRQCLWCNAVEWSQRPVETENQ